MDETLSLRQAADVLGVHYMTAYRYVRTGKLPAYKQGNEYRVLRPDLEAMSDPNFTPPHARALLQSRLVAADEPGAWQILEMALGSGVSPDEVYTDLLIPSINAIGIEYGGEMETVHLVHQATSVTTRLMARLGPLFRRRGTAKARVLIGAVEHDAHALAPAMMADLLRSARFDVIDLGANTPAETFVGAVLTISDVAVVALTATSGGNETTVAETIRAIKAARRLPVLVGGSGIETRHKAADLGADGWANSLGETLDLFHLHTATKPDGDPSPKNEPNAVARRLGEATERQASV